ncbi:MAG TPA: putative ABC transporter permease [Tenericutes bacterium]|nr:putative ABC transporter permease [Mycoplasmatota bacterium]
MYYFYLFFIYSIIGWVIEMFYTSYMNKKIVNRGFLLGPYCPIYGTGAMAIIFTLKGYENNLITLFVMSLILCSIIEYITSYLMEKLFNARWWDYTNFKYHINGRVCLLNSILFGLLGILLIKFMHPFINNYVALINNNIIGYILILIFITDIIISFSIISRLRFTVDAIKKDYTGEITEKIRHVICEKSKVLKRLIDAFPNTRILKTKRSNK